MVQSVLGSLILGYRPLWNRARKLAGVQLYVHNESSLLVDAGHLLRTLAELWSASSPPLLISPQTHQLLSSLLESAPRGSPWIEVRDDWLNDSTIFNQVRAAHRRGLKLVWRGEIANLPPAEVARCFDNSLLTLRAEDAIAALQRGPQQPGTPKPPPRNISPILAGQMSENVASRALMEHCLDNNALALAGWPTEDVLYSMRHTPQQPSHAVIHRLMKAIDHEQSLETFEDIMSEDPILSLPLHDLHQLGSPGPAHRHRLSAPGHGDDGVRVHPALAVGPAAHSSTEPNMQPIREVDGHACAPDHTAAQPRRGKRTAARRFTSARCCRKWMNCCAQPLGTILRRIPLSERIYDATVLHTGPTHPACKWPARWKTTTPA